MTKNPKLLGVALALVSSTAFGLSFIFTKSVVNQYSWLAILGWRFLFAALFMTGLAMLKILPLAFKGKPLGKLLPLVLLCPILYFLFETLGVKYTAASESSVIIATIPLMTLLFSILFLKERPSRLQFFGMMISLAGILLNVFAKSVETSFNFLGYGFLLGAVVSYSYYAILYIQIPEFTTIEKSYALMVTGASLFFPAALIEASLKGALSPFLALPFHGDFITAIIFLGIFSSVIAFLCSNSVIKLLGASRAASFGGVSTVISIIASVLILKEPFGMAQVIAAIMILGGVYMANSG